ncbi:M20/M25/M40 family metallo-hydrolase [Legionella brunensis]|uniref:Carboxypeptidase G2 n=1 Tax=Legionella brunensis TaxID=29422 RepID=A0A0W0SNQ8_9GAMM|nr:M20/M25/M40 family metallo-hydrolase [Legionella brunensis]KTC84841.1 carboxypeptidase G2 [Legionella brunensis]
MSILKSVTIKLIFISLSQLLFFQTTLGKPLSSVESKIVGYLDQQSNEQLLLLEKLVNINSGTTNIAGITQVGNILRSQFEQLGFITQWSMPAPSRAPTLIAEHKGNAGKKILLIGHLDTVFGKESIFKKFERHQTMASGPGIIDDKGGIVIMLYALKALKATQSLDNTSITVILTGDEENAGTPIALSRKPLFDVAANIDVALDFEWSMSPDTATVARRGITDWTLKVTGTEAHSSEIFQKSAGYGANFELGRILDAIRTKLSGEKYISFNPGVILGGITINENQDERYQVTGKDNVIAKTALAKGDLRFLTSEQRLKTKSQVISTVKQHLPGTNATINFEDKMPPMPPTPENLKLLELYSTTSIDLGYGVVKPLDPGLRGAGDISYIASIVPANLAGLGALGTGAHSTNETLNITSLPMQTQRAALLIHRLSH